MAFWKPSRPKDDEPAVSSVSAPAVPVKPKTAGLTSPKAFKPSLKLQTGDDTDEPQNKGFDPYNSGAFNLKDTWSRVNRKK